MTRAARVVNANAYRSYAEFAAEAHPYAELFEAKLDCAQWVNDDVLGLLHTVMPRLRAVCLNGDNGPIDRITSRGVRALIESTKIEAYHQYFGVNSAIRHAIAAAPLTTLSLKLTLSVPGPQGSSILVADPDGSLDAFENHPTLKHLSLAFFGYTAPESRVDWLPECLPNLETLSIQVGFRSSFNWNSALPFCPSLKKLIIDDQCGDVVVGGPAPLGVLTPRTLHQLLAGLPSLQTCHVTHVASIVLFSCWTFHDDERFIRYRTPPGVSLTFDPSATRGVRVVVDVDIAPPPLDE